MSNIIDKTFVPNNKEIKYVNRDYSQLKQALITYAKTYFPNTYKDFSDASPGMMFIDMASYVGDVLSYYTDYVFKEGLLQHATERKNIISLAKYLGYKPKAATGATGYIDLYQLCPAIDDGTGEYIPDPKYLLKVKENSQFANNNNSYYILKTYVDFSINTAESPRTDSVYSRNSNGVPEFFLLKKTGIIYAGKILTKKYNINSPTPFYKIYLDEDNVLEVLDVVDSDNNKWYEVDYLAQETVPISILNNESNEGELLQYKDTVPYIYSFIKTPRRFITGLTENNITYLEFGAGTNVSDNEIINLDPNLIGAGLGGLSNLNISIDPNNFLKKDTYGMAPRNTTLTVRYIVGGGLESNSASDSIKNTVFVDYENTEEGLNPEESQLLQTVKNSFSINNSEPCVGGKGTETNEEIKLNAMAHFSTQNRAVTQDDYVSRIYSLPSKFGSIAKVQVISEPSLNVNRKRVLTGTIDTNNIGTVDDTGVDNYFRKIAYDVANPFAINAYILSYDQNKNLIPANKALIYNLLNYLKRYKILTDSLNIIDGYIINIGVNFTISVYKNYNKNEVSLNCINAVKSYFDISRWTFSQPINLSQLQLQIANVTGVQSIVDLQIVNKTAVDGDYSPVSYDILSATKNGIIYPSVDPSIFEIKYPNSDIKCSFI